MEELYVALCKAKNNKAAGVGGLTLSFRSMEVLYLISFFLTLISNGYNITTKVEGMEHNQSRLTIQKKAIEVT